MKKLAMVLATIMMMLSFSACGTSKKSADGGITEITWYLTGVREAADNQMVLDEVNRLLAERYQLKLNPIFVDEGSFNQKMNAINASGEEYDLVYTSSHRNSFYQNVTHGCLADLTELLPKYAPKTYASMPEKTWECVKNEGKIYAVPNWQVQAKAAGLFIDKDVLDKSGVALDELNSIDALETYLGNVAALGTNVNYMGSLWDRIIYNYGMQPLSIGPAAVRYKKEGKPEIINMYDTDEFSDYVKMRKEWIEKGWITREYSKGTYYTDKNIRRSLGYLQIYNPGLEVAVSKDKGYEIVQGKFSDAVFSADGVQAALTGVSATSKHPEEAVKMIEVMNTDKDIFNLMLFGIEGKHYTKIDDNYISFIDGAKYDRIPCFLIGSQRNAYLVEGQPANLIEQIDELNNSAYVSPVNFINFDVTAIETEIANCTTVIKEQLSNLDIGYYDDYSAVEKFRNDLKTAGADEIIKELQRQVDEKWEDK